MKINKCYTYFCSIKVTQQYAIVNWKKSHNATMLIGVWLNAALGWIAIETKSVWNIITKYHRSDMDQNYGNSW